MSVFPVLIALTTEVAGESRATGVGMMALTNQAGGIGGAALAGVVLAYTGFEGVGYSVPWRVGAKCVDDGSIHEEANWGGRLSRADLAGRLCLRIGPAFLCRAPVP